MNCWICDVFMVPSPEDLEEAENEWMQFFGPDAPPDNRKPVCERCYERLKIELQFDMVRQFLEMNRKGKNGSKGDWVH